MNNKDKLIILFLFCPYLVCPFFLSYPVHVFLCPCHIISTLFSLLSSSSQVCPFQVLSFPSSVLSFSCFFPVLPFPCFTTSLVCPFLILSCPCHVLFLFYPFLVPTTSLFCPFLICLFSLSYPVHVLFCPFFCLSTFILPCPHPVLSFPYLSFFFILPCPCLVLSFPLSVHFYPTLSMSCHLSFFFLSYPVHVSSCPFFVCPVLSYPVHVLFCPFLVCPFYPILFMSCSVPCLYVLFYHILSMSCPVPSLFVLFIVSCPCLPLSLPHPCHCVVFLLFSEFYMHFVQITSLPSGKASSGTTKNSSATHRSGSQSD